MHEQERTFLSPGQLQPALLCHSRLEGTLVEDAGMSVCGVLT